MAGFVDHSHVTFASVEKASDGSYVLKPLKQKQMVDGLFYLMQEIYGIENKNVERSKADYLLLHILPMTSVAPLLLLALLLIL